MDLSETWAQLCAANERWTASDLRPMWEHEGPRPGLSESECWDVRRHHPEVPDAYLEVLRLADGWPSFYQDCVLFGRPELSSRPSMIAEAADQLVTDTPSLADCFLAAASRSDVDQFFLETDRGRPGRVFWYAGSLVDTFDDIPSWLAAMAVYLDEETQENL